MVETCQKYMLMSTIKVVTTNRWSLLCMERLFEFNKMQLGHRTVITPLEIPFSPTPVVKVHLAKV